MEKARQYSAVMQPDSYIVEPIDGGRSGMAVSDLDSVTHCKEWRSCLSLGHVETPAKARPVLDCACPDRHGSGRCSYRADHLEEHFRPRRPVRSVRAGHVRIRVSDGADTRGHTDWRRCIVDGSGRRLVRRAGGVFHA